MFKKATNHILIGGPPPTTISVALLSNIILARSRFELWDLADFGLKLQMKEGSAFHTNFPGPVGSRRQVSV